MADFLMEDEGAEEPEMLAGRGELTGLGIFIR